LKQPGKDEGRCLTSSFGIGKKVVACHFGYFLTASKEISCFLIPICVDFFLGLMWSWKKGMSDFVAGFLVKGKTAKRQFSVLSKKSLNTNCPASCYVSHFHFLDINNW